MKINPTSCHRTIASIHLPYLFVDEKFEHESPKESRSRIDKFAVIIGDHGGNKISFPETGIKERISFVSEDGTILMDEERLQAFEDFHAECHDMLKGWLVNQQLAKSKQEAEDIAQNVWKYVAEKYKTEEMGHRKMLFELARLRAYDYIRRKKRQKAELFTDLAHEEDATAKDFADAKAIRPGLNPFDFSPSDFWDLCPDVKLSEKQKEVVWLYGHEGLTFEAIERKTGVPQSTAHGWIEKSRKLFRGLRREILGS